MLCDYFPPHTGGGVEKVAAELCDGLVERGHTIAVLTLRTTSAPAIEAKGALTIYRVPALDLTRWLGVQFAASVHIFSATARLLRLFQPDVVHAHNLFFRTTEAVALLRKRFSVPLVTTLHLAKEEGKGSLLSAAIRAYESTVGRFIIRRSDRIITVSNAVAKHAQHMMKLPKPVTVIPNGVDTKVFYPKPDRQNSNQTILFVGRMVPNKGPEVLIRAVPAVVARFPKARFVLVGDGPLQTRLQNQVKRLGVGRTVQFLGLRHDVPDLMREACLMVRPSTLEGMPLTVLEAMASALPVVATPVGGTPELLQDGVHGYLVPVGDSMALANAIIKVLDSPALAGEMGRRGRELVEKSYSWEAVVTRTEQVYQELLQR